MEVGRNLIRYFIFSMLFFSIPTVLFGKVLALGADCSDGCDDYIPVYGQEWMSSDGYCCTGGGCPSFTCEQAGYSARICPDPTPHWTCCYQDNCSICTSELGYSIYWGTCDKCDSSDDGGGGGSGDPTAGTKWMVGRVWTDFDRNGYYTSNEAWGPATLSCSINKYDVQVKIEGTSRVGNWKCDGLPEPYYGMEWIAPGPWNFTLSSLPTGYNCLNPNKITWSFSNKIAGVTSTAEGNGCVTSSLTLGDENYLWWKLLPPAQPSVTVSPSSIAYTSGGVIYPIKVAYTDEDVDGQTRISTSTTSGLGTFFATAYLEFTAYANRSKEGIWPIAKIYGWRRDTGERVYISEVTIDSTTPKTFFVNVFDWSAIYGGFDFEFSNDIWDPATGTGTDIFIDAITFMTDIPMTDIPPWGVSYTVEAEDANLVVYDRGLNSRDGYDIRDPSISVVTTSGRTYTIMAWSGALRFPILWMSPYTTASGNITITVNDLVTPAVTRTIPVSPLPKTLTGKIWLIPEGQVVDNALCAAKSGSGLSATVTVTNVAGTTFSGTTSGDGVYSIPNIVGGYSNVVLSNISPTANYRIACINGVAQSYAGLTISGTRVDTTVTPNILDVGLRVPSAKKWIGVLGGDVYAQNITMQLPLVPSPCSTSYLCPVLTNPNAIPSRYVIGYGSTSSSVFASGSVPTTDATARLSESNVSATNIGAKFREKNAQYFNKLKTLLNSYKNYSGAITSLTATTFSATSGSASNSYKVFTTSNSHLRLATGSVTYSIASDGLVFLLVPKAQGSDNTLYIDYPLMAYSGYPNRRLVILADRNIKIGAYIQGTTSNPKTVTPHIMATIITTGDIEIVNYAGAGTPNTVVIEGSLIAGGKVRVSRAQAAVDNELRPVLFVRFKPLYITEFNKLAVNNIIPILSPLFTFDFSQEEGD